MLTVRDLLKVKGDAVWAISPETSILDTLRFMSEKNVGALVVLDEGILAGIISERDFVRRIAEDKACLLDTSVRDYMTTKVYTVEPKQSIEEVMQMMTKHRIRHLPVLENNQLVGIISIGDVVKGIIDEQSHMINNLEDYIMGTGYGH